MMTIIQHRFIDRDGSLTWYDGLIVGHITDTELFEVIYFGEDCVYEFELLEDYSKNDVKFIIHV